MSVERDDVAYVGRILTGSSFYLVANYGSDNNYAIPIIYGGDSPIILSKALFAGMNDYPVSATALYATFTLNSIIGSTTNGGIRCSILVSLPNASSPIIRDASLTIINHVYDNQQENLLGLASDLQQGGVVTLEPIDPSGYGNPPTLLTGVRYRITPIDIGSLGCLYVTNEAYNSSTGLYLPQGGMVTGILGWEEITWTLIPMSLHSYLDGSSGSEPPPIRSLIPYVSVAQCAILDNNYLNSESCTNWQNYRGFTTDQDVQPIIYFYSNTGQCGEEYDFYNNRGTVVSVLSSNGNSCNNCAYINGAFTCRESDTDQPTEPDTGDDNPTESPTEPDTGDDNGGNQPTEPDNGDDNPTEPPTEPDTGDDNRLPSDDVGILDNIWLWIILVIVIIVLVGIVALILFYTLRREPEDEEVEVIEVE